MISLYNTLSKKVEPFQPIDESSVRIYTCGPTVYNFAHIGNLRSYIFADLLRRTLEFNGLAVNHGMNITDVGHLTGEETDEGEDKMEVGALREGKHPLDIAKFYEEQFLKDIVNLNINIPHQILQATKTIPEQIEIISLLEEKGFIYKDDLAIYFDTSKLKNYGKLSGQKLSDKKTGAREEVVIDNRKRNPQDFVLWFFLAGRYKDHVLKWPSPWGEGFPGWHIECSAISRKLLGQPFDIHTGGVDHIGTHHTNEIAQSEAAFEVPLANWWMHGEFLLIDAGRMGKSVGNFITLQTIIDKKIDPIAFRYLCLTAHYRTQLNFTWESLKSAETALTKLYNLIRTLPSPELSGLKDDSYSHRFREAISNDLGLPQALAITWELLNDKEIAPEIKINTLTSFDKVLGLKLDRMPAKGDIINETKFPEKITILLNQRSIARHEKDFHLSDKLRDQIAQLGYEVKDTSEGQSILKK